MTGSEEEMEGGHSRGDGGGATGEEIVDWRGYEVWKGHLSDDAMKAIMSGGQGSALKAIGEEFGKMSDDARREMGSMDQTVGAQVEGEDKVTLATEGVEDLGRLVRQAARVDASRSTKAFGGRTAGGGRGVRRRRACSAERVGGREGRL